MALVGYPPPVRRRLQVFPFDPMVDRAGRATTIDVAFETLERGPSGRLVEVIDYDASRDDFFEPINLDDPSLLISDGLPPDESDPRFHQQMVYAVSMRVFEVFETALGRPFSWRGDSRLRIYPHAFERENAYFDPDLGDGALLFGYFTADEESPGENIPGQMVFTCLSHSIVAHECTHAALHRLRPHFSEPTNLDVFGLHEGLSDIVAYLIPFTYHDVVAEAIGTTKGDLTSFEPLLSLAPQFGFARGDEDALRDVITNPTTTDYELATASHDRGEVLSQAIMHAFLSAYQREASAIIRLATGGRGVMEHGALHPDVVDRLTTAAGKAARRMLNMCIRAIDYLPPVSPTFSDYLRAIVTADADLFPDDERQLRSDLIEAFRLRGIYPEGVTSLAERSLRMEFASRRISHMPVVPEFVHEALQELERKNAAQFGIATDIDEDDDTSDGDGIPMSSRNRWVSGSRKLQNRYAPELHQWATQNSRELKLDPNIPIKVAGFNISLRVGNDEFVREVLAVQFTQTIPKENSGELGGLRQRGGITVVADGGGNVRYVVRKPIPQGRNKAMRKLQSFVQDLEHENPQLAWDESQDGIVAHLNLRGIDAYRF